MAREGPQFPWSSWPSLAVGGKSLLNPAKRLIVDDPQGFISLRQLARFLVEMGEPSPRIPIQSEAAAQVADLAHHHSIRQDAAQRRELPRSAQAGWNVFLAQPSGKLFH